MTAGDSSSDGASPSSTSPTVVPLTDASQAGGSGGRSSGSWMLTVLVIIVILLILLCLCCACVDGEKCRAWLRRRFHRQTRRVTDSDGQESHYYPRENSVKLVQLVKKPISAAFDV